MRPKPLAKSGRVWRKRSATSGQHYEAGLLNPRSQPKAQPRDPSKAARAYTEGVVGSRGKWARGFKPYHEALLRLRLPPRRPMGDPRNLLRSLAVCRAMRAVKLRLEAAKHSAPQRRGKR